jgi:hypothetical protein
MARRKLDVVPDVAGFENVNVVLPVKVTLKMLETDKSTVKVLVTLVLVTANSEYALRVGETI